jgi:hypothetical protein
VRQFDRPALDFDRPATMATAFAVTAPWLVINRKPHWSVAPV